MRVAIVDDELPAVELVRSMLERQPDADVVATYRDGDSAVRGILAAPPDLVMLDVEMPVLDGVAVARALVEGLPPAQMPAIIFVTAFSHYAVQAFDVHAVDYVLKPVDEERFAAALERARSRMNAPRGAHEGIMQMLHDLSRRERYRSELVARDGDRAWFLPVEEIDWLEAARKDVIAHVGGATHRLREGIGEVEARLDPARFVRISRSVIVNIRRIREVQPWFNGELVLIMRDGARLTTGRTYRERIKDLLQ